MFRREELYGWKGFGQLAALFAFQGLLGIGLAAELGLAKASSWGALPLVTVAGALTLVFWLWHLLVPTLVRFELVFMPRVERWVLVPLFGVAVAGALLACCSASNAFALPLVGASVALSSLVSLAVAAQLVRMLRNELSTLAALSAHFERFARGRDESELGRLRLYLQQRASCSTPGIPIRGIEFPGLTSRPWHDPAGFPWMRRLEEAYPLIEREVMAMLAQPAAGLKQYRYPGVSSAKWQSLMLFCEPQGFVRGNCDRLPQTLALFRSLPVVPGREVMVSVLAPRSHIPPHRDSGNLTLTCQLGIRIPASGCWIRAGRERRGWTAGRCLVFDTTYEHEVRNDSDEMRVVFLFDFLHPDLSPTELAFFEQWARLEREASGNPTGPELGAAPRELGASASR